MKKEKEKYNWQWENSINDKQRYIELGLQGDPRYDPQRCNKSFSNHADTILQANDMNRNYHLDKKLQYDYMWYSVRKKKRKFQNRPAPKDEYFTLVQQYYKYSNAKTLAALDILTDEQLQIIKRKMDKGGIK